MQSSPEYLRAAFRLWMTRPGQALLSMLGVAVGVAGIFLVLAVGRGADAEIREAMGRLGAGTVFLAPADAELQGRAPLLTEEFTNTLERLLPDTLEVLAPQRDARARATSSAGQSLDAQVIGVTPEHAVLLGQRVARGRPLAGLDNLRSARVCVLGAALARALYPRGDALGQPLRLDGIWYEVVGVLPDDGLLPVSSYRAGSARNSDPVYVPLASPLFQRFQAYSRIGLRFRDEAALTGALPLVQRVIDTAGGSERVAITLPVAALRSQFSVQRTVAFLLLAASLVTLVVAGVGVMNMMLLNVAARRPEIGLRRAIGATRGEVLGQFLLEAVVLAGAGGLAGCLLGLAAATVVAVMTQWTLSAGALSIAGALLSALLIGALFGGYPAWRASGLSPVDTLRGPV